MEKQNEKLVLPIIGIVLGSLALLLSWIPIINNFAFFLAIVALILTIISYFINRQGKKTLTWVSLGLAIGSGVIVLVTQASYSRAFDAGVATVSSTDKSDDDNFELQSKNKIRVHYDDYTFSDEKTFKSDVEDKSWNAADVKINNVTVYKLSETARFDSVHDGDFDIEGFAKINMSVTAKQDINAYPAQADAVVNTSEQHSVLSNNSWDGDISKGVTKDGDIFIPIKKLKGVSDISDIRLKFSANYDSDNYDDNSHKDYDINIKLSN
ncbi:hypothetical protein OIT44_03010 [Weissella ceti]|uniref:Prophage pi3 protein 59 n=1 Tax=Weissella ceti TaxID=759620 RepID=A0ABT3E497_9LACO|nr:FUSC family protein [Weissella ceti]MCW0953042.1 hypothetical protein [Weissella ceti]QVK11587.1 DUF308 domain-containing protein [Weissella ceti]